MQKVKLTQEQLLVVEADAKAKLLVEAGPGTGKTEVACARAAWLIKNGHAKAHQILFVSFTRAAIKESRDRIIQYVGDSKMGSGVKISTLDSFAGRLLSGFGPKGINRQTYDENITSLLDLIDQDQDLRVYLEGFRHIIVDEGQDTYPPRSELVQELIWLITKNGGATVFFDMAQSIYGWRDDVDTEDEADESEEDFLNLPATILLFSPDTFEHRSLGKIHRSDSAALQRIFTEGREILFSDSTADTQLELMQSLVRQIAEPAETIGVDLETAIAGIEDGTFFLFERRAEALAAAAYISTSEYQIRLTGQESQIYPWIGLLLWDWLENDLTFSDFEERFRDRHLEDFGAESPEVAWDSLLAISEHESRSNTIDVNLLARRLSSSPPLEVVLPTVGHSGPVFSTIHGAKGLQADEVNLFLGSANIEDESDDEVARKARVVFVGASRARSSLKVGSSSGYGGKIPSGRAKLSYRNNSLGLEIGRRGDMNAEGLVGKETFASEALALEAQSRIKALHKTRNELLTRVRPDQNLIHDLLIAGDNFKIGSLSKNVGWDLRNASGYRKYTANLMHIRSLGIHTVAVAPEEAERSLLHYPWNQSGFLVSPSITGLPKVFRRRTNL